MVPDDDPHGHPDLHPHGHPHLHHHAHRYSNPHAYFDPHRHPTTTPTRTNTTTPTFTGSPAPCYQLDNLNDGDIFNSTNGVWKTLRWTSVNNYPVTPYQANVSSVILSSDTRLGNAGYSARVSGGWNCNGPTTYAGFSLGTELSPVTPICLGCNPLFRGAG
jgi:hypothetical protein